MPTTITGDMHSINKANFAILNYFGMKLAPRFTNLQTQLKHLDCSIQRAEVMKERILQELGGKYQKTPIQITLRWLFQKNIVSIPKATSLEHLKENLEIFDFSLSEKEMKSIASLNLNQRFV